jgi:hypothetical protein
LAPGVALAMAGIGSALGYCSARQMVASPHPYSRASSPMVSPAAYRWAMAGIEGRGPAELRSLPLGAGDAFFAALADQPALELGNAAHDRKHEPADIGGGVAPCFAERDKAAAALGEFVQDVVKITR